MRNSTTIVSVFLTAFFLANAGSSESVGVPGNIACAEDMPSSADWNQWRGPQRDGHSLSPSWPASLSEGFSLVWEKPLGPSYSGPVTSNNLVYTTETVDKKSERVTAFDIESGEVAWTVSWEGAMAVPFFAAANGDWIRATPACNGDALVVLGMRDVLVCLDAKTGNERWRVDFPKVIGSSLPAFGAVCSPLIDGENVYVQTGGPTVKVSLTDGSVRWQSLAGGDSMMSSGAFSSPIIGEVAGQRQLLVQTRSELCGVDLQTGESLWRQPVEAFRGMNILTPTLIGNKIFTAAHSGRSQLFEVTHDDEDGWRVDELWNQKTQGYMSSPVVIKDQIYLHAKNQRFTSFDIASGHIRWTSKPFGKYCSMIVNDDQILALDSSGALNLIAHDEKSLRILDSADVAEDAWAHLAIAGDRLFVRDLAALKVFRFKKSLGE
ncbi:outer membrane biogenesis protein BamB [Rubripirellula amarantea]|uniref:Outer membrane biogenesis protein BamB n=1 Tax=Rubripirellula amarantea TaxID=2527999 RepID=A0A5C5WHP9_9BACT|nr:PQQ-binding-like beta-propeller repeat protein [Rubripirellula amarantea]TWT49571.1 outer membrane biogenesis protein BamB [Rubripirellula amarantea]